MRAMRARCGPAFVLVLASLLGASCGGRATSVVEARSGISYSLPDGWHTRHERGWLRAATYPVPESETPFPGFESEDARLSLLEIDPASVGVVASEDHFLTGTVQFDRGDFAAWDGAHEESRLTGHGYALRSFRLSGRFFDVWVETGARPPPRQTLAELNQFFASLEVSGEGAYP